MLGSKSTSCRRVVSQRPFTARGVLHRITYMCEVRFFNRDDVATAILCKIVISLIESHGRPAAFKKVGGDEEDA
jgi:hypothetical protein